MFNMTVPWWELVVRGVVIYGFLLIMHRICGRGGGLLIPKRYNRLVWIQLRKKI